jgi:hypothetical protein
LWTVTDIAFIAPDTNSQTGTGDAFGSYGIRVRQDASLDLRRSEAISGNAAPGAAGSAGLSADPLTVQAEMVGLLGGDGEEFVVGCDSSNRGEGGGGGTNACGGGRATDGGSGGPGGTMDTSCGPTQFLYDATPGSDGNTAAFTSGAAGAGGMGGTGGISCGPTTGGGPGIVADGTGGLRATAASINDDAVFAGNGTAGTLGLNGSGGGGGGGSGGCDVDTDAYGPGGGGGGAGGCAASMIGQYGRGGGSSIGIAVFSGSLLLTDVAVASGAGGNGGAGGAGGSGQAGGPGESGGANPGTAAPGRGGDGARGGHSGGGGGGNGGHSFGIFHFNATISGTVSTAIGAPGSAGPGGVGATPATTGQNGLQGSSAGIRECADAGAC